MSPFWLVFGFCRFLNNPFTLFLQYSVADICYMRFKVNHQAARNKYRVFSISRSISHDIVKKKAGHLNYLLGSLKMKVRRPGGNHGSIASVYPCKVPLRPLCQITLKCCNWKLWKDNGRQTTEAQWLQKMTKSNYLSFWEYLKKIKILLTCTLPLCV
jgi:hypothetical protein